RVTFHVEPGVPSDAQLEHAIDNRVSVLTSPDAWISAKNLMLRTYTKPDLLPAYRGLFADRSGRIRLTLSGPGDDPTILRGEDGGRLDHEIRLPFAFDVFEVGDGYVV